MLVKVRCGPFPNYSGLGLRDYYDAETLSTELTSLVPTAQVARGYGVDSEEGQRINLSHKGISPLLCGGHSLHEFGKALNGSSRHAEVGHW